MPAHTASSDGQRGRATGAGAANAVDAGHGAALVLPQGRQEVDRLRAVSQWGFTPTIMEGRAVPVFMSIGVNFRLQ